MPLTKKTRLSIFEITLRQSRLKPTAQRRAVAERALFEQRHFTADELCDELRGEAGKVVSRASIYRTLQFLEQAKLIRTLETASGSKVYERSPLNDAEEHAHLICTGCDAIQDVEVPGMNRKVSAAAKRFAFHAASHSLTIYGTCAACVERAGCAE